MHREFFGYEHPIICAAMTCVSDVKLAIACAKAGIVPSLTTAPINVNLRTLDSDLTQFRKELGHCQLILGLGLSNNRLVEKFILKIIDKYKISHCEILDKCTKEFIDEIRIRDCKIIYKTCVVTDNQIKADAITVCGKESAGSSMEHSTEDLFIAQQKNNKSEKLIPSGGISTKKQIDYYLGQGALAVSIGTLFAASEESIISNSTKHEMILKSSSDLTLMKNVMLQGIIYKDADESDGSKHPRNPITNQLAKGVQGELHEGLIFAGTGIDQIKEILPVHKIVQKLTEG